MTRSSFEIFETVRTAWDKVKGAKGLIWFGVGLFILTRIILMGLDKASNHVQIGFDFILGVLALIIMIIQVIIYWGTIYVGARRAKDEPISLNNYKYTFNFRLFLKMIGLYLAFFLIFLIPVILILIPLVFRETDSIKLLAPLFFIIAAISILYLSIRLYISKILVIVDQVSPFKAISLSFQTTKNNFWKLLGLTLLNFLIILVSLIPLGIGLIWSIPYAFINYGVVYKRLMDAQI